MESHNITITYEDAGTCGDHYCSGHRKRIITCSCGAGGEGEYLKADEWIQKHEQEVIREKLGVEFKMVS